MQAQTTRVCTKHLLRFYRLRGGDCTGPLVVLCDLETYRYPRTILVKEEAERFPLAS
jgi:hypothetical protein